METKREKTDSFFFSLYCWYYCCCCCYSDIVWFSFFLPLSSFCPKFLAAVLLVLRVEIWVVKIVYFMFFFCYFSVTSTFFLFHWKRRKRRRIGRKEEMGGDGKQFWRHRRQKERWQWWSMTMALMVSLGVFEVFADSICFKYQQHYRCVSSTPSLSSVFCCFYFSIWLLFLFFSLLSPLSFLFPPWIKEGETV